MTDADDAKMFRIAVGMNLGRLPQLKGKGAPKDRTTIERGVDFFCDGVLDQLKLSGFGIVRIRPQRDTRGALVPEGSDNVVIPVGLPRAGET